VRVAVVGAGPAGAVLAWRLAGDGADVTVFDASHPREKPCGGGVTAKGLDLLPPAPPDDPVPGRRVEDCRFDSGQGEWVDVHLTRPMVITSRRELDAWLLRRAVAAGARHVAERVVEVSAGGRLRTRAGSSSRYDLVVGADGATSLVRRTFLGPVPPERLCVAAGWYARGTAGTVVQFMPGLAGYLWLFPRPDHVGVGICAPLRAMPTRQLLKRLEWEVARHFPALLDDEGGRYAHTLPSPSTDPRSVLEVAGPGWALVGDAAALADPVTGEGIHYAFRSAHVLADTLRDEGSPARYPERVLEDFGRHMLKAAAIRDRFYAPGFPRRMVRYAAWSPAIQRVLVDLVLGEQGYLGLKRRLLRAAPRFALDATLACVCG
jgi:geranylgeranyl diphosphate/geranylgeranyl-bacteriochlorophyllide a reductase